MAELHEGDPAPDFEATTTEGKTVRLADYGGKHLVVYFFPKAFTTGCTIESRRFRDRYGELRALGAEVLGVSMDDPKTQCEFAESLQSGFPMIGDSEGTLSRAFGVKRSLLPLVKRVTFVIRPDGRIGARFSHELLVGRHVDDVLDYLRTARKTA